MVGTCSFIVKKHIEVFGKYSCVSVTKWPSKNMCHMKRGKSPKGCGIVFQPRAISAGICLPTTKMHVQLPKNSESLPENRSRLISRTTEGCLGVKLNRCSCHPKTDVSVAFSRLCWMFFFKDGHGCCNLLSKSCKRTDFVDETWNSCRSQCNDYSTSQICDVWWCMYIFYV